MITLEISKRYQTQIDTSLIKQTVNTTLIHQGVRPDSEISIIITGDEKLHALNLQFLDVDAPTDVLSFPADFTNPDTDIPYMGDILISFPRAEIQASAAGHAVMAELQLLVVHGILHLLGYDHAEEAEKVKMWNAQRGILQQLGLGNLKLPNGVGQA